MAKRQLTEGNYPRIALIGVVVVLLIATAVSLLHQPTSKEEYLVWRQSIIDATAQMDRLSQLLVQADELAKAGDQPAMEALKQTILDKAKAGTEAARGCGGLDVRNDDRADEAQKYATLIVRQDPFQSHRMAAIRLGIFNSGGSYKSPAAPSETYMYISSGNGLRDMLRSYLITLDAHFGVR